MQFSKIKRNAEKFLAPALQGRIAIYSAVYRKYHDQPTRTWLTFDGEELFSANDLLYYREQNKRYKERRHTLGKRPDVLELMLKFYKTDWYKASSNLYDDIERELFQLGVFDSAAVQEALMRYNELAIKDALTHEHPFIRGYALLDARVGKRTLAKMKQFSTIFEQRCYDIRMQAELEAVG